MRGGSLRWLVVSVLLSCWYIGVKVEGLAQQADLAIAGLISPNAVFVDPLTRALWVSERDRGRVLRYGPINTLNSGSPPLGVLGQPNLTSITIPSGASRSNLNNGISYLWVDVKGTLWVCGAWNRVVWWKNAASQPNGANATGVLGQPNFASSAQIFPPSASSLISPYALCVVQDTLWVADYGNNRVLRFDNASSLPETGAVANSIIGKTSYTDNTVVQFGNPTAVLYVPGVGLFVAEFTYKRLLYYTESEAYKLGGVPLYVYGKYNLTQLTNTGIPNEFAFDFSRGLSVAPDGTLFASVDYGAIQRVLMYPPVPPTANQVKAIAVFGQPDLNSANGGGSGLGQLSNPRQNHYDPQSNTLWVADLSNGRVVRYSNVLLKVDGNASGTNVDLNFNYRTPDFSLSPPGGQAPNATVTPNLGVRFFSLNEVSPAGNLTTGSGFQTDGYSITFMTDIYNNLQYTFTTNQPADLLIEYTLFTTTTPLSSAGVNFTGDPGALKMAISISNWQFNSSQGLLELTLNVVVSPPVTFMSVADTPELTTYTLRSSNVLVTTIRLLKFCVTDNETITPINFTLTETSSANNRTNYALVLRFPYFSQNVFYDPDFSVTLTGSTNNGDGEGGDPSWLPFLALVAVVIVPLVFIVIGVVVGTWCAVSKYRQRLNDENSLHQINF